ncbi:MAG: polysaccharide deacetylase family protein [Candidatus Vogelbacteria bacterium]|nr:polysaccharide deacetylase family protein [Candidatus Vogelbacteria bacterium]
MLQSNSLKLILGTFVFFIISVLLLSVYREENTEQTENSASLERLANRFANNQIGIPFLIYHSVRPHITNETAIQDAYDITPKALDRQFEYLKNNGYHTVYPRDLVEYLNGNLRLPNKPIVISFDDGWENQYKYAFPLIQKYDFKAIFYIYSRPLDIGAKHFLTWSQIKEMLAAGMEIGDHTLTHPYLMRVTDPVVMRREILGEKLELEKRLGIQIKSFAYPFGHYNNLAISMIKSAGLTSARTTYPGVYKSGDDLYKMKGFLTVDDFNKFLRNLKS